MTVADSDLCSAQTVYCWFLCVYLSESWLLPYTALNHWSL